MAEPYFYIYDSAVPDYTAEPTPVNPKKQPEKPKLHKVKKKKQDLRASERKANLAVAKVFAVVVVCTVSVAFMLSSFSAIREAESKNQKISKQFGIYNSKLIQLDSELSMLVTPEKIEQIAVGKLGMIKLPQENKLYSSVQKKNKIVLSPEHPTESQQQLDETQQDNTEPESKKTEEKNKTNSNQKQ